MASGRIPFSRETELGQELNQLAKQGVAYRKAAQEMYRKLAKYADATASIAADLSDDDIEVTSQQATTIRDLIQRSAAETAETVLDGQSIAEDTETNTKVLLDTIG